jgi:septum formation protein
MDTIILASGSPRRRELLERVRIPCRVVSPQVDEAGEGGQTPAEHTIALARRKVDAVLALLRDEAPPWVLGADTVVEIDGRILGKPAGAEEAERYLRLLSARVHRVHTGLALHAGREQPVETAAVCTEVCFRTLDDVEIGLALASGEWVGAAGAYRIQERGAFLVEWIRGSWSNVVGLPLEVFYGMLKRTGYRF